MRALPSPFPNSHFKKIASINFKKGRGDCSLRRRRWKARSDLRGWLSPRIMKGNRSGQGFPTFFVCRKKGECGVFSCRNTLLCFKVVLDKDWKFIDGLRKKTHFGYGVLGSRDTWRNSNRKRKLGTLC